MGLSVRGVGIRAGWMVVLLVLIGVMTHAQNTLQYYVDAAQANSPVINDNLNQADASKYESERLRALYLRPQVGISASYMFAPIISKDNGKVSFQPNAEVADRYFGYDLAASNGGTYQALLNLTQPLFNRKTFETANEQLYAAAEINRNNAKLSAHDIEKAVTDQYILCTQDRMQLDYVRSMHSLLKEQREVLEKLVEHGIYLRSDLTQLQIETQNMAAQQAGFMANYRRDLLDLNIMCGINDTAIVDILPPDLEVTQQATESNSFFLEKYRLDSMNLMAQQHSFELKYRPQVSFFANTGLNAVYAPTMANRFGLSAGITFNYNFFDGGQKKLNRNKIGVNLSSIEGYKKNFIDQNTVRKTKILNEMRSYDQRMVILEQQLEDYRTLLDSYRMQLVSGQLSVINYITTVKNMAAVQRDHALLFTQRQLLINAYNYWNW
ncbi:MAG: hypothetical protein GC178_15150 [Flavobacteriales bacterium]|nr:hypothetical protein [Flavobacteriales bacterium]